MSHKSQRFSRVSLKSQFCLPNTSLSQPIDLLTRHNHAQPRTWLRNFFVLFCQSRPKTVFSLLNSTPPLRVSRFRRTSELKCRQRQLQFSNAHHLPTSSHHGFFKPDNMASLIKSPSLKATTSTTTSASRELPTRRLRTLRPAGARTPASTQHYCSWACV